VNKLKGGNHMKKNTKMLVIALVMVGILLFGFYLVNASKPKDTIKLGMISGLSGGTTSFGIPALNAAQLAVNEINSKGGVKGHKLELIVEDGQCDGKLASDATNKLINIDHVPLIYTVCSTVTLSSAKIANESSTVVFGVMSASPAISSAGDYVFRISPNDTKGTEMLANYMYEEGYRKVSILTAPDAFSASVQKDFENKFKELGGTIVFSEQYSTDQIDFRTEITKIKSANTDAVLFLPLKGVNSIEFLKQLDTLANGTALFSTRALVNKDVLDAVPTLLEGVIYSEIKFDQNKADFVAFLNNYRTTYNTDPTYSLQMVAGVYDSVYITAQALEKCDQEDTECIKDYLYSVKDYDGTSGTISFDKNGDPDMYFQLNIVRDGKATLLK